MKLTRAYYTCLDPDCKHTEFPLDRLLGLSSHAAAGKFAEEICHLAATQPFDQARGFIANFDRVEITETMIRETAEAEERR